jgi:hypothetical protein
MAANGFINNTQLDLASYKNSLKDYLSSQQQFRDYDFEGSNLSVLLDVLAFNTYHNAVYLNMIGSEMFLDTAELRDSIVSHAKELNYIPRSRSSSRIKLRVQVNNPAGSPDTVLLPSGFTINGRTSNNQDVFLFVTDTPVTLTKASNYIADLDFYQGANVLEAFDANSKVLLSSQDIDTSSIKVFVKSSAEATEATEWTRADNLFGLSGSDEVYFLQGAEDFKYEITFGNGVVGKALQASNVVIVTYRETVGETANGTRIFSASDTVNGASVSLSLINATDKADGGSFEESDESIRFNSTRYFQTQERAITSSDFVTLIKANFPSLRTVIAYGGEEATPPRFGKVIISAIPFEGTIIADPLKERIREFAKSRTTLSIDPLVLDPDFLYVEVNTIAKYSISRTIKPQEEIAALVRQAIQDYSDENLREFGSDVRFSKLIGYIDDADASILSNQTDLRISKRISPIDGVPFSISFSFENKLLSDYVGRNYTDEDPVVVSTPFVFRGTQVFIQDNGLGVLQIRGATIDTLNIGTVNYETGAVSINPITIDSCRCPLDTSFEGNFIKIFAKLQNDDVETSTNKVLVIEQDDIAVSAVAARV